jgi:hypothetical protein
LEFWTGVLTQIAKYTMDYPYVYGLTICLCTLTPTCLLTHIVHFWLWTLTSSDPVITWLGLVTRLTTKTLQWNLCPKQYRMHIYICKFSKLPKTGQSSHHKNIMVEFASQNSTECIYISKFLKSPKTGQSSHHKNIIVEFTSQNSTECIYICV